MPSLDESGANALSKEEYLAVGIVPIIISSLIIGIRLVASIKQVHKLYVDDYTSIIGMALLIATFAVAYQQQAVYEDYLLNPTEENTTSFLLTSHQMGEATLIISNLATWFTKTPVLLLLMRIFAVKTWLTRTSCFTLLASLLIILSATAYGGAICNPKGTWSQAFSARCTVAGSISSLIAGFTGLAVDLVMFILPLPIIVKLHLPLRKKIGLVLVFMAGLAGIVASIVGNYSRVLTLSGSQKDRQISQILVIYECAIVLAVGCVPAIHFLWRTVIVGSFVYTRVQSIISMVSQMQLSRSKQSEISRSHESSGKFSDGYIRMETTRRSDIARDSTN